MRAHEQCVSLHVAGNVMGEGPGRRERAACARAKPAAERKGLSKSNKVSFPWSNLKGSDGIGSGQLTTMQASA
jgi:hypothetical protein